MAFSTRVFEMRFIMICIDIRQISVADSRAKIMAPMWDAIGKPTTVAVIRIALNHFFSAATCETRAYRRGELRP
jgi:uncharacterized membrane protein